MANLLLSVGLLAEAIKKLMAKKIIVTHKWPDFDAVAAVWLVKRYLPGFKTAEIKFVSAGCTFENKPPDSDPNVVHVDTGKGRFDHHQNQGETSAAEKVFQHLKKNNLLPKRDIKPLERIVKLVNFFDNFKEVTLENPTDDIYDLLIPQIIEGLNLYLQNSQEVVNISLNFMEALLLVMKNKIKAEEEVKKGLVFKTCWGKAFAIVSGNEETVRYALKSGYAVVVRKDPNKGFLRIKASPLSTVNLTDVYKILKEKDPSATWFLHESKKMLLNGSAKNPSAKPTKIGINEVVEILKTNVSTSQVS